MRKFIMTQNFIEQLNNEILVFDGAMGTILYTKGIYINRCFDELNLSNPKLIKDIHQEYLNAGADIIETNTFGANSIKLTSHGLEEKIHDINYQGAQIAKEIAADKAFVAGSIGPLGRPIKPIGTISSDIAYNTFYEQAKALHDGDVDFFSLETFIDLNMLEIAIKAVQEVSSRPIIAHVSFSDEAENIYGLTPSQAISRMEKYNLAAIGVNCSTGPQPIIEKIEQMTKLTSTKLSAMPNAGMPKFVEGRLIYLASPEYFAEYAKRFIQTGVSIVGGCCGTTPDHIRAIKAAVKALRPTKTFEKSEKSIIKIKTTRPAQEIVKSNLQQKLIDKKFITSIELSPPRSPDISKVEAGCKIIKASGVDAVNIPDGPRASARMSPLALSVLIETKIELDTILHYTCRDRNILGIQSDLLGAHALGLRNILSITGDPPKLGDYPNATAVFNIDSIGLLRIAVNLNHSTDLAGNPIDKATSFFMGVGVNPGAINFIDEMERLKQKIDAGAEYILTQPLFELSLFDKFMEQAAEYNIPVIAGILPLASYRNAEFLHNEVPGMSVPQYIREKLQKAKNNEDAREIGIESAQQMLERIKPDVQGVYLMPPFGRYGSALKVLEVL